MTEMVVPCLELGNKLIMLSDSTVSCERPGHARVEKRHQLKVKRVKTHKAGKNTKGRRSDRAHGKRKAIVSLRRPIRKAGMKARVQEEAGQRKRSFASPLLLQRGWNYLNKIYLFFQHTSSGPAISLRICSSTQILLHQEAPRTVSHGNRSPEHYKRLTRTSEQSSSAFLLQSMKQTRHLRRALLEAC